MDAGTMTVSARPLSYDAVFRIEVSLSSRRSSAIVMRTTARLYTLEGTQTMMGGTADVEWKPVAYGAPCIQLMKETTDHNSPFNIKIVIAEVESGIALWEGEVGPDSNYHAMQSNFHTFVTNGRTNAIQFASEGEGGRMLESLQDLFLQKQKAETVSFDKKPEKKPDDDDDALFKKPKSIRRLTKKEISAPCNFKHVSGITMQRTQSCEEELRGTIQRKMRSMSLSSLNRTKSRPPLYGDMVDGIVYPSYPDVSPELGRKTGKEADADKGKKRGSVRQKFGSLRLSWKKGSSKPSPPDRAERAQFVREVNRQSLPSHFRKQVRPGLSSDTFTHPHDPRGFNRAISLSSGNLLDYPSEQVQRQHHPSSIQRRHTVLDHSPSRRPVSQQFNYTPYAAQPQPRSAGSVHHQPQAIGSLSSARPYMSEDGLNQRGYRPHEIRFVDARTVHERQRRLTPERAQIVRRGSLNEAQVEGRISFDEGRPQVRTSGGGLLRQQTIPETHTVLSSAVPNGRVHHGLPNKGNPRMHPYDSGPQYATVGPSTRRHTISSPVKRSMDPGPAPQTHYDILNPRKRPLPPTPFETRIPRAQMQGYNPVHPTSVHQHNPVHPTSVHQHNPVHPTSVHQHNPVHPTSVHQHNPVHPTSVHQHNPVHPTSVHQHNPVHPTSVHQVHPTSVHQVHPTSVHQVNPASPTRSQQRAYQPSQDAGYAVPQHTRPLQSTTTEGRSQASPSHTLTQIAPSYAPTHLPPSFQPVPVQVPQPPQQSSTQYQLPQGQTKPSQMPAQGDPSRSLQLPVHNGSGYSLSYDVLHPTKPAVDHAESRESSSDREIAEMTEEVTEQMNRVLEQFDSLLAPKEPTRQFLKQTAL